MKYIFLIFFVFSSLANAQGDLQFNQIVEVDLYHAQEDGGFNNTNAQKTHEVQVTIPEGKVWKISSVAVLFKHDGIIKPTGQSLNDLVISVNDVLLYAYNSSGGFRPTNNENVFPKWLSSGDYTFQLNYRATNSSSEASEVKSQISGIEFNIIQ